MKVALTHNAMIKTLTLPEGAVEEKFWDHGHEDALPGFGLRLRAGGSRTWIYQFKLGAKHNRLKIGSWPLLTLEKARATARELRRKIEAGGNPAAERVENRKRANHTFESFVDKYLLWRQRQKKPLKPRAYEEVERHMKMHAKPLHAKLLSAIDRRTIAAELAEIEETRGPVARNRVRASWSAFFMWLLKEGHLGEDGQNPVAYTNKAAEVDRERVLTDGEMREILAALPESGDDYGDIVRLLLLTGQRRDEIASLAWDEVDFDDAVITLPGARTKNRREHIVTMAPAVVDILKARKRILGRERVFGHGASGRGFQNWSACKESLDSRIEENLMVTHGRKVKPMPEWRLHDLRRTMSTVMNDQLGVAPHVAEAILNHVSTIRSGKSGVGGVYNKAIYLRERTEALRLWADHVTKLVATKELDIAAA